MTHSTIKPVVGGKYNWRNQSERLVYMGLCEPRNGRWHQFAKVEEPTVVWCEVTDNDLAYFEESEPTDQQLENKLIKRLREPTEIELWNQAVDAKKAVRKLRLGGATSGRFS